VDGEERREEKGGRIDELIGGTPSSVKGDGGHPFSAPWKGSFESKNEN
jgi:hypothetical protein